MKIKFTKMHGAGNDFIVINGIDQDLSMLTKEHWKFLGHRQFGIGADQILIIERPQSKQADFRYRIINNDGSEVEQCGNGSRCFVRFVHEKKLSSKKSIDVEVAHTVLKLTETDGGDVIVNMGTPIFTTNEIPFLAKDLDSKAQGNQTFYGLPISSGKRWIAPVSMGNPHAVQIVDEVENYPVRIDGPEIESHPAFPNKVNAGFMQIIDRHHIRLRVYERGAGETLSCGTGACAAAVSGIRSGLLESPVHVQTHGGELRIDWDIKELGEQAPVMMTGPAQTVFEGEINLPDQLKPLSS